ncbi:MAG: ABC transporter substrate-binding protein [Lachnospiraceae bacterium]|nr:ABC transporter substrate-binding protein [Lachnospiraceae bacterium]
MKLSLSRKYTKALAVLAAFSVLVTGCGGSSSPDSTTAAAAGAGPAAEEAGAGTKDTLVVAVAEDATSLDPQAIVNQKSFSVYCNIYENLVRYNAETQEVEPCLATEWEQVDDVTYHFKLREGVKFHDGNTMTAEDVIFSFKRAKESGVVSTYLSFIDSVEADGDYAVTMHISAPYAQIYQSLSNPSAVVVSKAAVEKYGDDFSKNPVGTGAYKFVEWKPADSIVLTAFEDYWGEPAGTKNVEIKVIPEGAQRTIMLENGEVDIASAILLNDAARIEENEGLDMLHETGYKSSLIYFKTDSEKWPIGNKLVRQAFQYAINKQEIVDSVIYGYGQVGSLYATPLTAGYNAEKDNLYSYDPQKAKDLLAEAGYPDGFEMDFYCETSQTYEEIATILQAQLAEVGIKLNVTTMESNTINERFYSGEEIPNRMGFYNNLCGDVESLMQKLVPDAYGQVYFNDEIEALMMESRSKTDPAERQDVYDKFWDIMNDDVPWITLYYEDMMFGINKKVEGFKLNPVGANQYKNVTVYE